MGAQKNRLIEMVLLSTHNICFGLEIRKLLFGYALLTKGLRKINFFQKNYFRNTIIVSNNLEPDQARHIVGPDRGPNCLQRLSGQDTSRQTANETTMSKATHFPQGTGAVPSFTHLTI